MTTAPAPTPPLPANTAPSRAITDKKLRAVLREIIASLRGLEGRIDDVEALDLDSLTGRVGDLECALAEIEVAVDGKA
jgi:hypothetical protein